jgi:hypothetical protein
MSGYSWELGETWRTKGTWAIITSYELRITMCPLAEGMNAVKTVGFLSV